jgi:hypothetical protein
MKKLVKDKKREQRRHYTHHTCRHLHNGLKCQRQAGHGGVHISDETGKLIYWISNS